MIKHNRIKLKINSCGFTMVELMVALAIVGILAAYGIPAYNQFAQRQSLSTETNNFLSDLNFARNLAIDKGTNVSVISNSGADWENGWTIVQDLPADPAAGPTDPVPTQDVRLKQEVSGNITITENGGLDRVTYDSQGGAAALVNFTIQKVPDFPNYITLTVSPSGLASSNRSL